MHFRRVSTQLSTNESTYFMVNRMYMIHNSIYIILLYICICVCIRNEQPKALIETGACRTLDLIFQTRHAAKRREPQAHPPLSLFFRPSHPFCRLTFSSSSLSFFLFNMMLIMQQAKSKKRTTAPGIPTWSPTVVLTERSSA